MANTAIEFIHVLEENNNKKGGDCMAKLQLELEKEQQGNQALLKEISMLEAEEQRLLSAS